MGDAISIVAVCVLIALCLGTPDLLNACSNDNPPEYIQSVHHDVLLHGVTVTGHADRCCT